MENEPFEPNDRVIMTSGAWMGLKGVIVDSGYEVDSWRVRINLKPKMHPVAVKEHQMEHDMSDPYLPADSHWATDEERAKFRTEWVNFGARILYRKDRKIWDISIPNRTPLWHTIQFVGCPDKDVCNFSHWKDDDHNVGIECPGCGERRLIMVAELRVTSDRSLPRGMLDEAIDTDLGVQS